MAFTEGGVLTVWRERQEGCERGCFRRDVPENKLALKQRWASQAAGVVHSVNKVGIAGAYLCEGVEGCGGKGVKRGVSGASLSREYDCDEGCLPLGWRKGHVSLPRLHTQPPTHICPQAPSPQRNDSTHLTGSKRR